MPSAISIKLQSNFIEIALRHGCSLVNSLHIFRTRVPNNTSGGLIYAKHKINLIFGRFMLGDLLSSVLDELLNVYRGFFLFPLQLNAKIRLTLKFILKIHYSD